MTELAWLAAPAAALLFGCLALVPLGRQVLARGVIFIDLAVAQVAACGALAGHLLADRAHARRHADAPRPVSGHSVSHSHAHSQGHRHVHDHGHGHGHGEHAVTMQLEPTSTGTVADPSLSAASADWPPWLNTLLTNLELLLPALFASVGALLVWYLARRVPGHREALIGLVYVAAASTALLMASTDPHGREQLDTLLAADVLWATWPPVLWLGAISALVWSMSCFEGRRSPITAPNGHDSPASALPPPSAHWRDSVFYPVFAIALSVAVPVLGLYLVFAMLIGPSLWHRLGVSVTGSCLLAALACTMGLAVSWSMDWPSGTCVAISLSVLGLASAFKTGGSWHA
ncbi:MAG: metal ABC transporter permease [Lautropia sp.]|nr:metal ABC transporter permease [Lautropia sp.]